MYFVTRGRLQYLEIASNGKKKGAKYLTDGMWCSECALWSNWVHKGTLIATTHTEVFAVHSQQLAAVAGEDLFVREITSDYREAFQKQLTEQQEDQMNDINLGFSFSQ